MSIPTFRDIGFWLKASREALDLNQEEVAKRVNLPRSAISLIEAGKRSVSSVELARFADLYRRSLSYFLRPAKSAAKDREAFSVLLRAEIVSKKDRPELISLYEFFKTYTGVERLVLGGMSYEVPEYMMGQRARRFRSVIEEGEHLANDERGRLGLGNAPISDIYSLFEREGIKIHKKPFPSGSKISGCFFFNQEIGPCIVVNTKHRPERTNFTAAHEYCHFLRDSQSLVDYACNLRNLGEQKEVFEIRANAFAANFLMPADGINEYLRELGGTKRSPLGVDRVVRLQRYFRVSYAAMLYRLKNLGWISDEEMEKLKVYKPTKIAKELGLDMGKAEEVLPLPLRFIQLAIEAYKKEKISLGKLAELLNLTRDQTVGLLKSLEIPLKLGPETKEELLEEIAGA